MKKIELLAPAGNLEKLKTALHFGADAVYFGGNSMSLRAFAGNFADEEISLAVKCCHDQGKKAYITLNIFAHNADFSKLHDQIAAIEAAGADAVIVSDLGIASYIKRHSKLSLHVSTQANVTNKYAAAAWRDLGADRIVLARELSLAEISEIADSLQGKCELEAFVHGAMCISYSGRCLLSNYLSGRDSNRGECVQACRWEYSIRETSRKGDHLDISEDSRGTYILNSKDLNLIGRIDDLRKAGVVSFKIEGRMKTAYYVATVVNAYRRSIDAVEAGMPIDSTLMEELFKTGHRTFTEGFLDGRESAEVNLDSSRSDMTYDFIALVKGYDEASRRATIEQRNRFFEGDMLEILSPGDSFQKEFEVSNMTDCDGNRLTSAHLVQQVLSIDCPFPLKAGDILRKRID